MRPVKSICTQLTTILSLSLIVGMARSDPAGDKKRAQLALVHRIAVVPIFFATDTLGELPPRSEDRPAKKPTINEKRKAQMAEYVEMLGKLEAHSREYLLKRVTARTPYQVVPPEEMESALKELNLTPPQLFQNGGRLNSKHFDTPDPTTVHKLAVQLHADAVIMGTLDEPRKSNGYYYFDLLGGAGYESPKVEEKADYNVFLADGALVLHQTIEVLHPVTRLGNRQFLLADWMETEDEVDEDFLDELTRYTPIKK